jgi:hypothetical protein
MCKKGCPIATPIPEVIAKYKDGKIMEAGQQLFENNPMSVFCSIVCDHQAQCAGHCVLGRKGSPVHFYNIEEYVSDAYLDRVRIEKIEKQGKKAAVLGAGVELTDRPGYAPERHDRQFMELAERCCRDLAGEDKVQFDCEDWSTGSSDFGDITCVMPGVQFNAAGATGTFHGIDFAPADPERLCINSVKAQLLVMDALLSDGGSAAKKIVADYEPEYPSIRAYLDAIDQMVLDKDAVVYDEDGNASVDFQNKGC